MERALPDRALRRAAFRDAWSRHSDKEGRVHSSVLRALLTDLGFRGTVITRRQGVHTCGSASELDVVNLLTALGVGARDIAAGVLVPRDPVEQWFLLQPPPGSGGCNARANPLLTRPTLGTARAGWHDLPEAPVAHGSRPAPTGPPLPTVLRHEYARKEAPPSTAGVGPGVGYGPHPGEDGRTYGMRTAPHEDIVHTLRGPGFRPSPWDPAERGYVAAPRSRSGTRLGRMPPPRDTRGNTLRRVAVLGTDAVEGAGGLRLAPSTLLRPADPRMAAAAGTPSGGPAAGGGGGGVKDDLTWKSRYFRDVPARVPLDGQPGTTLYSYSRRSYLGSVCSP